MDQNLLNLIGKEIADRGLMTDDKGLFQGGEKGRVFGRLRDSMDRFKQNRMKDTYNLSSDAEAQVVANADKGQRQAIANNYEKSDQMYKQTLEDSKNLITLRQMSKELDISNPEAVKQWQERAGLKVDGMFGPKSLHVMRKIQANEPYKGIPALDKALGYDSRDFDEVPSEEVAKFNENQASNASRFGYGAYEF